MLVIAPSSMQLSIGRYVAIQKAGTIPELVATVWDGVNLFWDCLEANAPLIAFENPRMNVQRQNLNVWNTRADY